MHRTMEVSIIRIGNSKGIRLSKALLERYHFKDKAEIVMKNGYILLKPVQSNRIGWGEKFKQMNQNGEDQMLFDDLFEEEGLEEWK